MPQSKWAEQIIACEGNTQLKSFQKVCWCFTVDLQEVWSHDEAESFDGTYWREIRLVLMMVFNIVGSFLLRTHPKPPNLPSRPSHCRLISLGNQPHGGICLSSTAAVSRSLVVTERTLEEWSCCFHICSEATYVLFLPFVDLTNGTFIGGNTRLRKRWG